MSSQFGNKLKISVYGQSHGKAIGVLIDGLPAGEKIDMDELNAFMSRRKPGGKLSTSRKEADMPVFLSGLTENTTCGSPLCAMIENGDAHSGDYESIRYTPRPAHADYTAYVKWAGSADMRGGGHFSGRLTAPLCIAGGIAKQILAKKGIFIGAHLKAAAGIWDESFPLFPDKDMFETIASKAFPVISDEAGEKMQAKIMEAKEELDSVGGIVECAAIGVPAGFGDPMFDGVENRVAGALFGIPAVKGVEFGKGFDCAGMRGSENNDPMTVLKNGSISFEKNDAGGILGGITTGMPIVVRAAFKPTPSIAKTQRTVDIRDNTKTEISIKGRHDPCIAHRAVPVVEAVMACVILDMILEGK
ncbi:MAG: chorismate synthase [Clostridiales bacterium]|nr:chorismate synthase [Clostridiales bacterium]